MHPLVNKITESTVLPISLVITIIGGVIWLTSIKADTVSLKDNQDRMEKKQDEYNSTLRSIDERLSRIEGRLNHAVQR